MFISSLLIFALLVTGSYATEVKQEMIFVGAALDGKVYFTLPNQTFTWQDAKNVCELHNLTMGSIRSAAQTHVLTQAASQGTLDSSVWTSARVYYENAKSLKWDNTVDSQPDEKLFVRFQGSGIIDMCGWYETRNNMFYSAGCTQFTLPVLCQNVERP